MEVNKEVSVLSIDAWRNADEGWYWNSWYKVGAVPLAVCDLTPRKLLRYMRDAGYLSKASAGRVSIDDDGYNVVICDKANRMPVFALAYGEAL